MYISRIYLAEHEMLDRCGIASWQEREVHAALIPLEGLPRAPPAWTALSLQVAAAQARENNVSRIHDGSRQRSHSVRRVMQHCLDWRKRSVPDVEGAAGNALHYCFLHRRSRDLHMHYHRC